LARGNETQDKALGEEKEEEKEEEQEEEEEVKVKRLLQAPRANPAKKSLVGKIMGIAKDLTSVRVKEKKKRIGKMKETWSNVQDTGMVVQRRGIVAARGKMAPGTMSRATVITPLIGEAVRKEKNMRQEAKVPGTLPRVTVITPPIGEVARKDKSMQQEPTVRHIQPAARAMLDMHGAMTIVPTALQAVQEGKAMQLGLSVMHIRPAATTAMDLQGLGMEAPATSAEVLPMAASRTHPVDHGDQAILLVGVLGEPLEPMAIQSHNIGHPAYSQSCMSHRSIISLS